jgi:hypothetical protein
MDSISYYDLAAQPEVDAAFFSHPQTIAAYRNWDLWGVSCALLINGEPIWSRPGSPQRCRPVDSFSPLSAATATRRGPLTAAAPPPPHKCAGVVARYALKRDIQKTFDGGSYWVAFLVTMLLLQLATLLVRPAFYSRHRPAIAEANRALRLADVVYRWRRRPAHSLHGPAQACAP